MRDAPVPRRTERPARLGRPPRAWDPSRRLEAGAPRAAAASIPAQDERHFPRGFGGQWPQGCGRAGLRMPGCHTWRLGRGRFGHLWVRALEAPRSRRARCSPAPTAAARPSQAAAKTATPGDHPWPRPWARARGAAPAVAAGTQTCGRRVATTARRPAKGAASPATRGAGGHRGPPAGTAAARVGGGRVPRTGDLRRGHRPSPPDAREQAR